MADHNTLCGCVTCEIEREFKDSVLRSELEKERDEWKEAAEDARRIARFWTRIAIQFSRIPDNTKRIVATAVADRPWLKSDQDGEEVKPRGN